MSGKRAALKNSSGVESEEQKIAVTIPNAGDHEGHATRAVRNHTSRQGVYKNPIL